MKIHGRGKLKEQTNLDQVGGVDEFLEVNKGLLDGTGGDEAGQDGGRSSLVVGAGGTSTTEGLLTDDGTGALVVDVEVSGSVAELVGAQDGSIAVLGEEGTSQGIGRRVGDQVQGLLVLLGLVDVDGDDGSKDLLGHGARLGVGGDDDGGLDEVSDRVVVVASGNDLRLRVGLGPVDVRLDLVERELVDDGAGEVLEVLNRARLDAGVGSNETLLDLGPEVVGEVAARAGRALLSLVLE